MFCFVSFFIFVFGTKRDAGLYPDVHPPQLTPPPPPPPPRGGMAGRGEERRPPVDFVFDARSPPPGPRPGGAPGPGESDRRRPYVGAVASRLPPGPRPHGAAGRAGRSAGIRPLHWLVSGGLRLATPRPPPPKDGRAGQGDAGRHTNSQRTDPLFEALPTALNAQRSRETIRGCWRAKESLPWINDVVLAIK